MFCCVVLCCHLVCHRHFAAATIWQLGDDLFLVPGTAPSMATTSAGASATSTHEADGAPGRQQGGTSRLKASAGSGRTRTTGGPSGGAPLPGVREEGGNEVYGGGGGMQHAW